MPGAEGNYKKILTEIIQKQMVVFGPTIALDKARKVAGLKVSDNGEVIEMGGNGTLSFKSLAAEYGKLSAEAFNMSIKPLKGDFSEINNPNNQPK